jgi:hypothetical protein
MCVSAQSCSNPRPSPLGLNEVGGDNHHGLGREGNGTHHRSLGLRKAVGLTIHRPELAK